MTQLETAYKQGREAKDRQHERISPYINLKAEKYWYAGYDGISFEDVASETS